MSPRNNRPFHSRSPQTQPFQGNDLPINKDKGYDDLGREDARQIRENKSRNTRYVDKPTPTTDKVQLQQLRDRQNALIQDGRQQMMGGKSSFVVEPNAEPVKTTSPSGRFNAPRVPQGTTTPTTPPAQTKLGQLRDTLRGGITGSPRPYKPTLKGNVGTAIVSAIAEPLIEPLGEFLGDRLAEGIFGVVGGDSGFDSVWDYKEMRDEVKENDARMEKDAELVRTNDLTNAPVAPVLPSKEELDALETPSPQPVPERIRQAVQSTEPKPVPEPKPLIKEPQRDTRNDTYNKLRSALTKNSTKAEHDAVRDAGLAKHKELFPQLYK